MGSGSLAQLEVRMLVIRDGLDPKREAVGGRENAEPAHIARFLNLSLSTIVYYQLGGIK